MDLKSLTDDVLYETYRTEKLSRMVHADHTDDSILPEDLATQSVRLKEEQLRREEEKASQHFRVDKPRLFTLVW